jgi:hypothetical protein
MVALSKSFDKGLILHHIYILIADLIFLNSCGPKEYITNHYEDSHIYFTELNSDKLTANA